MNDNYVVLTGYLDELGVEVLVTVPEVGVPVIATRTWQGARWSPPMVLNRRVVVGGEEQ